MSELRHSTSQTLLYYEREASELSLRYESAVIEEQWRLMEQAFPPQARVLDIGCGTGRDIARLRSLGRIVHGADGSIAMLATASSLHPELEGCLWHVRLPGALPFTDGEFDGVMCMASLMHFDELNLLEVLSEIGRVLKAEGRLIVSVPSKRSGIDTAGVAPDGRFFLVRPLLFWAEKMAAAGFDLLSADESADVLGRDEVVWLTMLLGRTPVLSRSGHR